VGKGNIKTSMNILKSIWLTIEDNKKSKFGFKFWSYSSYLNKKNQKKV